VINDRLKQLGGQYLLRTREELVLLHREVAAACQGRSESLLAMRHTAHRICGSGAMLGFKAISDAAGHIERILRRAEPVPTAAEWAAIMEQLKQIEIELDRQPPVPDVGS
jgi:HPt (histidine-containing phosphotransfer) domain-containing protein